MGSNFDPSERPPTWGEFYSLRAFVDAASVALRLPPWSIEHVTRAQVREVTDSVAPKRYEPLEDWCRRAVDHWVAEAKAGLSTENRRFPCT